MSGAGSPELAVNAAELNVSIVASTWHAELMEQLVAGARKAIQAAGGADPAIIRVPGAFELPLGAARAIDWGADAVVALGIVIRGETPHFEFVSSAATDGLLRVQLDSGVPIGFGLLTVDDVEQAAARSQPWPGGENKGAEAAQAAIAMVRLSPI